ncbi:MAG: hypothetical protein ACO3N7_00385 [Kiritimatiellia bacterium]
MNDDSDQTWSPENSKLKLKSRKVEEELLSPTPPPPPQQPKNKKPAKASGSFRVKFLSSSIGTCAIGCLILGAFLYHQVNGLEILTPEQAIMTRGIAVVAFFVLLVVEAFTEDMLQGILSLFLPPYAFIYGLLFADAGPIRGLTMAMVLFLSSEIYFTQDDALVLKSAATINEWIDSGQQKLINPDKPQAGYEK